MIVLSTDPETIFVPSGENATERIEPLWALVFSLFRLMTVAAIIL